MWWKKKKNKEPEEEAKDIPIRSRRRKLQNCPIHNMALESGDAPFIHDSIWYTQHAYIQAQKQFMYASSFKLFGSPLLGKGNKIPKTVPVQYCSACRLKERQWLWEHQGQVSKGLFDIIFEAHDDTTVYTAPISILARVYFKSPKDGGLEEYPADLDTSLYFGKPSECIASTCIISPLHAYNKEPITYKGGETYRLFIKVQEPDQVKEYLFPKMKFFCLSSQHIAIIHGEIIELVKP